FYRNVLSAAFEIAPDATMEDVWKSVRDFAMPGNGIDGFTRKAVEIAVSGIYDLKQHRDEVLLPILRKWSVFERNDFGPAGELAREELAGYLANLDQQVDRFENRRESLHARLFGPTG
ncbi:MAG: acyl-ACP desaturase, partial [Actinobacteria bacterium]|nr:acyl-ACP desaturase [Actinomycetota bacterium]